MPIAIPTDNPGGLDATRSEHFGRCDNFTLTDLDEHNVIQTVTASANGDHEASGCMVPLQILKDAGADAIIVSGLGARPIQGFDGVGITVYYYEIHGAKTGKEAVEKYVANQLLKMHANQVCNGSGGCTH